MVVKRLDWNWLWNKYGRRNPLGSGVHRVMLASEPQFEINHSTFSTRSMRSLALASIIVFFSNELYVLHVEFIEFLGRFALHNIFEFAVTLGLCGLLWLKIETGAELRDALHQEQERVARLSGELGRHVEQCFRSWQLTAAEREVAWLLLKGFSFAEIGSLRAVKEKTLRQQATSIYAKAEVSGRSELAATFLEDVLVTDFAK